MKAGEHVGAYVVERLLGSGGMADVWQVRHAVLGTKYALKRLRRSSDALRTRLLQEGHAQRKLRHPALLPVHEILSWEDGPGLLMPLINGPTLTQLLRHRCLSLPEVLVLFAPLLDGLDAAHQMGFVHRDIKPSNILLQLKPGRLQPRLTDFGLVKEIGVDHTRTGAVFGTPAYASPEQLHDASAVTFRSDLFSMGVLLVELATGHLPFSGRSVVEMYNAHQAPPNLDGMPDGLRPLAASLLETDPSRRPVSCEAVRRQLGPVSGELLRVGQPLYNAAVASRRVQQAPAQTAEGLDGSELDVSGSGEPVAHNLSAPRDRFVGRVTEQQDLRRMLQGSRMVTVTGFGGIGKSRLVLETARQMIRGRWPGGIWFVPLVDVRSVDGINTAVAAALGVQLSGGAAQLATALRSRGRVLLILDNFEQIADYAEDTVGVWLGGAPELVVLVTSREPLWVKGEQLFALEPFGVDDAKALFIERARAASPRFRAGDASEDGLHRLVALLDGLPLAIELAAARSRAFSPAALSKRLQERFDLLSSRSKAVHPRQRTLRATLKWSWDLLEPWEQRAMAQASVFEGGFTAESAAEVLHLPEAEAQGLWVEDVLAELVDKHLLLADGSGRMRMLVSIQHFAAEHLDDRAAAEQRHGAFFAELGAPEVLLSYRRAGGEPRRQTLADEADNLVIAVRRAVVRGDTPVAAQATLAVGIHLLDFYRTKLFVELLTLVYPMGGPWRAELMGMLSFFRVRAGDHAGARALAEEALTLARPGWRRGECYAHYALSQLAEEEKDASLASHHDQLALACAEELGHEDLIMETLGNALSVSRLTGEHAANLDRLWRYLALARRLGNERQVALAGQKLGVLLRYDGQYVEARQQLRASVAMLRTLDNPVSTGIAMLSLSRLERMFNDHERAGRLQEEALAIFHQNGEISAENVTMRAYIVTLWRRNELEQAAVVAERALAHTRALDNEAYLVYALACQADARYRIGDTDGALSALQEMMPLATRHNMRRELADGYALLCDIHRTCGRFEEAQAALDQLFAMKPSGRFRQTQQRCTRAALLFDMGETEAAHALVAEVAAMMTEAVPLGASSRDLLRRTRAHIGVPTQ